MLEGVNMTVEDYEKTLTGLGAHETRLRIQGFQQARTAHLGKSLTEIRRLIARMSLKWNRAIHEKGLLHIRYAAMLGAFAAIVDLEREKTGGR